MKLLRIVNKKYALFSGVILMTGVVLIYFFLQYYINSEVIEKLVDLKQDVIKSLDAGDKVEFYPLIDITELKKDHPVKETEAVTDTVIFNPVENEPDSYKQIRFIYSKGDRRYLIFVRTDNIETMEIMFSLGLPLFILILTVLIISNIIINRINFRIWKPFYSNLNRLKSFSASDKEQLHLTTSEIDEFRDLNKSLIELTDKVRMDYSALKEFSENASHELQTPLSIIKVKIESMMQNEKIEGEQLEKIRTIYRMINRLTSLNRSLTLLSKLGSIEYERKEKIFLNEFISKKIGEFLEIAEAKQISIITGFNADKFLSINPDLLEILFSNLLSNAIKYNIENGTIHIDLYNDKLVIINTGGALLEEPQKMFDRFVKGEQSEESSGLGLTIVKQICDRNNFDIRYTIENSLHIIRITFPH